MSTLSTFRFENREVRFVGTADTPEWVAQDVCESLEIKNTSDALRRLDGDEKGTVLIDTPGGRQEMLTVNEFGLYSLVLSSRKLVAKRFKHWITHEVIPAIRKTGTYSIAQPTPPALPPSEPTVEEIGLLFSGLSSLGIKPELVESAKLGAIARSIPRLAPAAEEGKRLLATQMSVEDLPISPTELGKAIAEKLGWAKPPSAQKINQALQDAGLQVAEKYLDKHGKPKTDWHLTEAGKQHGETVLDTARGHNKTVFRVLWFKSAIPLAIAQLDHNQQSA